MIRHFCSQCGIEVIDCCLDHPDATIDSVSIPDKPPDIASAINLELDRLGWSSEAAPEGNTCLDAFPTDDKSVVVIEDTQESTLFFAAHLLATLRTLSPGIGFDDLWNAMLPHMAEE